MIDLKSMISYKYDLKPMISFRRFIRLGDAAKYRHVKTAAMLL